MNPFELNTLDLVKPHEAAAASLEQEIEPSIDQIIE